MSALRKLLGTTLVLGVGAAACTNLDGLTSHAEPVSGDDAATDGGNAADGTMTPDAPSPGEVPGEPSAIAVAAVPVVANVTTLAGSGLSAFADGTGSGASFNYPEGVAVDPTGNVYVADSQNHRIRKITPAGVVTTLAGSGTADFLDASGPAASFNRPIGITIDTTGGLYVADYGNQRIRKVSASGSVTTLAGSGIATFADGIGIGASFYNPVGVTVDVAGNVFVADSFNFRIRKVTPAGVVTTPAGQGTAGGTDSAGGLPSFSSPQGVAFDAAGNLYVGDAGISRIRKMTSTGLVTTPAGNIAGFADGTGAAASFDNPAGVAADTRGNIYIADSSNHRIRKMTTAGVVTTLAGSGASAFADGTGSAASFNAPSTVAVDAAGRLYVGDSSNHRIRKLSVVGVGQLDVTWSAPSVTGSSAITGYVASASAAGHPSQTCTSIGPRSCTINGLTSGVVYNVSVVAKNAAGTSPPSSSTSGTPN